MVIKDEGTKSSPGGQSNIEWSVESVDLIKKPSYKTPEMERSSPRINRGRKQTGQKFI